MRSGTSGLLFSQNENGSIRIEVVDYEVKEFGGGDWESWYELDKENADLLYKELSKSHSGTFKEMLIEEFEKDFNLPKFEKYCKDHNINYQHLSWF